VMDFSSQIAQIAFEDFAEQERFFCGQLNLQPGGCPFSALIRPSSQQRAGQRQRSNQLLPAQTTLAGFQNTTSYAQ
jgi:hypothetical protein